MVRWWTWILCYCWVTAVYAQSCHDIDTQACTLMAAQDPSLCQDPTVGHTVCPRFCNLCPLECFHCNATVQDYRQCATRKACASGERCLLKQVSSTVDGHHEYVMSCASPQVCDGVQPLIIGRRDISVQCCSTDGCNYPGGMPTTTSALPPTTAATGCYRDIEVLIEDTGSRSAFNSQVILEFLKALVNNLDIGPNDSLMGLARFDTRVNSEWKLRDHQTKSALLRAIDNVDFDPDTNNIDYRDVIVFLERHLSVKDGDRTGIFDDVVLIISDIQARDIKAPPENAGTLPLGNKKVIVLNLGQSGFFDSLAHDTQNVIDVANYNDIFNYITPLISLICL